MPSISLQDGVRRHYRPARGPEEGPKTCPKPALALILTLLPRCFLWDGPSRSIESPSWAHLGAILGPFWGHLGPSWAHLGPSWAHLIFGLSWALFGLLGLFKGHVELSCDCWGLLDNFSGQVGLSCDHWGWIVLRGRYSRISSLSRLFCHRLAHVLTMDDTVVLPRLLPSMRPGGMREAMHNPAAAFRPPAVSDRRRDLAIGLSGAKDGFAHSGVPDDPRTCLA